jgi:hypothetical protein
MYSKDDVTALVADLGTLKLDPAIESGEAHSFGLGLDVFDPVSGQIMTVARPQRRDIGQSEILMTAAQVAATVATARHTRLIEVRAAGYASIEQANEAAKRQAVARALATKHAAESAALAATQAEAAAKAAADAAPKPQQTPPPPPPASGTGKPQATS